MTLFVTSAAIAISSEMCARDTRYGQTGGCSRCVRMDVFHMTAPGALNREGLLDAKRTVL